MTAPDSSAMTIPSPESAGESQNEGSSRLSTPDADSQASLPRRASRRVANARHHQPKCGRVGIFSPHAADHVPLVDDHGAVGESQELVQILGDEQDGTSPLALFQEQPVRVRDRPHVETPRRRASDQQRGLQGKLSGQTQALLAVSREDAHGSIKPGHAHPKRW
jgi:hypothetical protein